MIFFIFFSSLFLMASAQDTDSTITAIAIPVFELPDSNFSSSGSIKMSWFLPDSIISNANYNFELQQSTSSSFDSSTTRYSGPDLASYISGLKNGNYHYRVRSILDNDTSLWSKTVLVSVEHHSLQLAFTLFGLGAVVFIATVFVVVRGARRSSPIQSTINQRRRDL
jgi:hypothetical protein